MTDKICKILDNIRNRKPLVHAITNPISINQCANTILAVGAKPIMAEHPKEVYEITASSDALMLNLGNITDARMESMIISLNIANKREIPVLLDAVGVACSELRREYTHRLLKESSLSVIKGNYSEIASLYDREYYSPGVDADSSLDVRYITNLAKELSQKYKTVIIATGKTDVVTDGKRVVYIKNGSPSLSSVTGTGCMLGSLCATFMTSASSIDAAISACCYFGICGELAKSDKGIGSFMINLIDKLSTLNENEISEYINVEEE